MTTPPVSTAVQTNAGYPDLTFNRGLQVDVYPWAGVAMATSIAPLADESMLVATFNLSDPGQDQFNVTKVLPRGTLATDFGNHEQAPGEGFLKDTFGTARVLPQLHALDDGSFYVLSLGEGALHMARYTAAGLPGAAFEGTGSYQRTIALGALDGGTGFHVQGELISTFDRQTFYIGVTAVLANGDTVASVTALSLEGVPVPGFNGTGQLLVHPPRDVSRAMQLRGLDVHRDASNLGKPVVAVGWAEAPGEALFIARFDVNGTIDATFAERGFAWVVPDQLLHMQVVVDPSGTVKLCGTVVIGPNPATEDTFEKVFAFTASGQIDTAFNGGTALLESVPNQAPVPGNRGKVVFRASEQPEGYRLTCTKFAYSNSCVTARLLESGAKDAAFGETGRAWISHIFLGNQAGETMKLHPGTGKILVARHIYTFRYNA